uniref:Uncharacterized protein n=1 Tax=Cacopsylla melanoneura TaxID=428564 RepID=A0A8D8RYK2_9HEMI
MGEFLNGEAFPRPVRFFRFLKVKFFRLLVDQEYISMKSCSLGWRGSSILSNGLTLSYITARNIHHQPMPPFSSLGFLSAWSIRICHDQSVVRISISFPADLGGFLQIIRFQFIPKLSCQMAIFVGDLQSVLRSF